MTPIVPNLMELTEADAGTYAGIGSRETPPEIRAVMTQVAQILSAMGWTLNSGGAEGADLAFEAGATQKNIFLPYKGFNKNTSTLWNTDPRAYAIAACVHPAWDRCNDFARKAHARNAHQVLGTALDRPVAFLLCWTKDGATRAEDARNAGGSRTAIVLAAEHGAPVINLQRPDHLTMMKAFIYRNADLLPVNDAPTPPAARDQTTRDDKTVAPDSREIEPAPGPATASPVNRPNRFFRARP